MTCDICGKKGARIRRVSRNYGKGEKLLVIENVPVVLIVERAISPQRPYMSLSVLNSTTVTLLPSDKSLLPILPKYLSVKWS
jgi:YgiT-type zinc finger domain-containing protein